jgi:hypothetical protein
VINQEGDASRCGRDCAKKKTFCDSIIRLKLGIGIPEIIKGGLMDQVLKQYLVEIVLRSYINTLYPSPFGENHVCYEEVLAEDVFNAKEEAYAQFKRRCSYEPVMRRILKSRNLDPHFCEAGDAICIEMQH